MTDPSGPPDPGQQPGPYGSPPPPGGYGAPPPSTPPPPGGYGAPPPSTPPPPGGYGAPPPSTPPPPGGYGGPPPGGPPPGGFQPAAVPYQYGGGPMGGENLANPWKRILARIVDGLIFAVVLVPLMFAVIAGSDTTSESFDSGDGLATGGLFLIIIIATVGQVLYEVGFIAVKGQTPGKMLLKVKVVRADDHQIPGWGPAFMRWLPNLVGVVPFVGSCLSFAILIWALVNLFANARRQTPFDLLAKTVVLDVS